MQHGDFTLSPMTLLNEFKRNDEMKKSSDATTKLCQMNKDLDMAWKEYMKNPDLSEFPPKKISHTMFNLTEYIYKDFEFFVRAILQSKLKTTEFRPFLDFEGLYDNLLAPIEEWYYNNYFYQTLFFGCSYGKELKLDEINSVCDLFQTALTNNGLCYSFNGLKPSDAFRKGKIVETVEKITNESHPNFLFKGQEFNDGMLI